MISEGSSGKKGSKNATNAASMTTPSAIAPMNENSNGQTINVCDPFSDEFAVTSQRPPSANVQAMKGAAVNQSPPGVPPGYFPKPQFRGGANYESPGFNKNWPSDRNQAPMDNNVTNFGSTAPPTYRQGQPYATPSATFGGTPLPGQVSPSQNANPTLGVTPSYHSTGTQASTRVPSVDPHPTSLQPGYQPMTNSTANGGPSMCFGMSVSHF